MTKRFGDDLYYPHCWCGQPWARTCQRENESWDGHELGAHFKNSYVMVEVPVLCSCGKEVWECDDYKAFKKGHTFDRDTFRPVGPRRLGLNFISNDLNYNAGAAAAAAVVAGASCVLSSDAGGSK